LERSEEAALYMMADNKESGLPHPKVDRKKDHRFGGDGAFAHYSVHQSKRSSKKVGRDFELEGKTSPILITE